MWVQLLGPVRAEGADGTPAALGGIRLRAVLAMLALEVGRTVRTEALIDGLWGDAPPADAANALQSLVSRLRRSLRAVHDEPNLLRAQDGGYLLQLAAERTDAGRFATLLARGRTEAPHRGADAAATLDEALALWRGDALADLTGVPFADAARARLAEARLAAVQERAAVALQRNAPADALAVTDAAVAATPLREPLVALRMRALHAAGRQSDALELFERTRIALADELGVDPAAELRAAHAAVLRGDVPAEPEAPQRILPPRLTSFVGREDELAALADRLAGTRLLTLAGPGGAGKTSLATELLRGHDARVFFVPLAGVRSAEDVPTAVLGAISTGGAGLLEATRPADPLSKVVEALSGAETVLLLDNCEHLLDGAAALAERLLRDLPRLRVLATSREPLAITGETLYQLGPLSMPEPGTDASAAASVRLFTDRARAVRHDFDLKSTMDAVTEICVRLDGMPLALELAAARLRSMSAAQIAARLDDRFRLLSSGSRTALPRHRTLRAVMSWSWELLAEDEAALAAQLSVFPAPATAAAIEQVSGDGDVLYLLGSLVEKSIVDLVRPGAAEPRYRMLETIRAYAAERLAERDGTGEVSRRFAEHYLELAERLEPQLRAREQLAAIATLDADYDNLIAALRWATGAGAVAIAARMCQALLWYWTTVRGLNAQARRFISDVLELDGIPAHSRAMLRAAYEVEASIPGTMPAAQAAELIEDCVRTGAVQQFPHLSLMLVMLALLSRDEALLERESARAVASEDAWSRGAAHWARSFAFADGGDQDAAARERAAALAEFRAVGERWGIAMALGMEADHRSLRNDHAGAIALLEESLAMAQELRSGDDLAQHLWRLASERMRAGDVDGAWRNMAEAQTAAERTTNGPLRTMMHIGFAELARKSGDFELSRDYLDRFDPADQDSQVPRSVIEEWLALHRAALAACEKDGPAARAQLRIALRSATGRLDMSDLAQAAEVLAMIHAAEDDPAQTAFTLGVSAAIRGILDEGNDEVRVLVAGATAALGEPGYRQAYRRGAELSREDSLAALRATLDP